MSETAHTESGREDAKTMLAIVNPEPSGEYRSWPLVVANKPARVQDGIITEAEHAFYEDGEEAANDLELHHENGDDHLELRRVEVSEVDAEEVRDR